ncbi:MAG: serine aminopeptidase domain-containing protein [Phycisphaerae bacterium]
MRHKRIAIFVLASAMFGGCNHQPYVSEERLGRGLVVVLSGVEGRGPLNEAICRGLDRGGVEMAIENYSWALPGMVLYNLRSSDHHTRKAEALSRHIAEYKVRHPGRPVFLVGHSGGAAIAVWATERLPAGSKVDGIVLLAPALSPKYSLQFALAHSRRGVVSFHSRGDWVLLGMGTQIAGTMDGKHTASAGMVGFEAPPGSAGAGYPNVYQIAWKAGMSGSGHVGGHLTSGAQRFVSGYVAPLMLSPRWNSRFVGRVEQGTFACRIERPAQPLWLGGPLVAALRDGGRAGNL